MAQPPPSPPSFPASAARPNSLLRSAGCLLAALALLTVPLSHTLAQQLASAASTAPPAVKPPSAGVASKITAGPLWHQLTPAQQQALRPLAGIWNTVDEPQKNKWLAISRGYPKLPTEEQVKLHSRMIEWVALSPQQRAQARLNFTGSKHLPSDEKKAKWEAYQALSPEERQHLATRAPRPRGAAGALKPAPRQVTTPTPALPRDPAAPAAQAAHTPRIAIPAQQSDHRTLLPQPLTIADPRQ